MRVRSWLSVITLAATVSACEPFPDDAPSIPTEVQWPGESFFPEGIAASKDGTLYAGSLGTGAIARVKPGSLGAEVFVPGRPAFGVYGLEVDEAHDTLWACTYDDLLLPAQASYLNGYALSTGALKASHAMPSEVSFCNDVTVDVAGNVYVTDSFGNAIFRLAVGGTALDTWSADAAYEPSEPGLITLNGIAYDGANRLYVVKSDTGALFSIDIQPDGSAGAPVTIPVTPALETPDGVEWVDSGRLFVVENTPGRASLVTLGEGAGAKEVLANGFVEPTAAALTKDGAWVLESQMGFFFGTPGTPALPFRAYRVAVPPLLP
ncbi:MULTISPECIES: SMP-30/gluconolactonase/LRE family protein [unclassified Corallococcus]|uniref:SMP-30/gluconolactonase/LRE family protein n=1 Tax=unclassified Corallococcus TaxID=2685029 RepID=UPI001A8E7BC5|nr:MULTISPECIES: SMP-30/gluconolactonase/LRE family protein [unclassified Corallococcus]MBN9686042.1 SMP-30/gluconolactonase/LRE family protein [Corallococcus sp. NCSPR001]WAS82522.1 SMP-30/gluconolactonase/LRE family protein [Corallococcus sp. NCRR]